MYTEHEYNSAALYHSGVKGMKWGVRRYRNEDGTLTEAGKKRYARLNKEVDKYHDKIERRIDKREKKYIGKLLTLASKDKTDTNKYSKIEYKLNNLMFKRAHNNLIRDIKKSEIEKGLDYYEKLRSRREFIGFMIAGVPGEIAGAESAKASAKKKFGNDPEMERLKATVGTMALIDANKKVYKDEVKERKQRKRANG